MKTAFHVPVTSRVSFLYAERGILEVDGHAVVLRQGEMLTHFPVGGTTAVILMPGSTVTHAAVRTCAEAGCLLIWTGEHGVRLYAAGNPGRAAEALLRQASIRLDPRKRLACARAIFRLMFNEDAPGCRSVEQLRGMEGARVKALYQDIAEKEEVAWTGRKRLQMGADPLNSGISAANAALYGLVEAVILAIGYAPSIGFVHDGDPRSFVFDLADCLKFHTVVPLAMRLYKDSPEDMEGRCRRACRDLFKSCRLAERIVSILDEVINAGLGADS